MSDRHIGNQFSYDVQDFIEAYVMLDTNTEVAKVLGISVRAVVNRADYLRRVGIALPFRQVGHNLSMDEEFQLLDAVLTEVGAIKHDI